MDLNEYELRNHLNKLKAGNTVNAECTGSQSKLVEASTWIQSVVSELSDIGRCRGSRTGDSELHRP